MVIPYGAIHAIHGMGMRQPGSGERDGATKERRLFSEQSGPAVGRDGGTASQAGRSNFGIAPSFESDRGTCSIGDRCMRKEVPFRTCRSGRFLRGRSGFLEEESSIRIRATLFLHQTDVTVISFDSVSEPVSLPPST